MTNYEHTVKNCLQMVEQNDLVLIYTDEWKVYFYSGVEDEKLHNFIDENWLIRETDINELEKELQKLIDKRG